MAVEVAFRNLGTNEIKRVKVGWSWTLFLFGSTFGIPFFFRKIYLYGFAMIGWDLVCGIVSSSSGLDQVVKPAVFALSFVLGSRGNKLTAEYYLKHGWEFADPDSDDAVIAREKWALA